LLPGLCRVLLGEELRLPSVSTQWCGQGLDFGSFSERLDQVVIKRAFSASEPPIFPETLDTPARDALLAQMAAQPFEFVLQERVALGTVPALEKGRMEPRPYVMRTFVCATPEGAVVMPGGLTRFSSAPTRLVVSMQSGGGSKDTWVLASGPLGPPVTLRASPAVVRVERAAAEVPSRVADNLYWFGRYSERLEDTIRVLRCILLRLNSESGAEGSVELAALVRLLAQIDIFPSRLREKHTLAGVEREIYHLVYSGNRLGTIREIMARLNQLAFALRDRFSADTWSILCRLQEDARLQPGRAVATETLGRLNSMVADLAALSGMEMENMTRGHGWRLLDLGRRLERAINITTLLDGAASLGLDSTELLEPVLEIGDSVMTYRRRYFAQPQWPGVLDLLLSDDSNPRALAFQARALASHATQLPGEKSEPGLFGPGRHIATVLDRLHRADWPTLTEAGSVAQLRAELGGFAEGLRDMSDSITHLYFSHADSRISRL
jgi:uncharacterized alpha-E superfamily protein